MPTFGVDNIDTFMTTNHHVIDNNDDNKCIRPKGKNINWTYYIHLKMSGSTQKLGEVKTSGVSLQAHTFF